MTDEPKALDGRTTSAGPISETARPYRGRRLSWREFEQLTGRRRKEAYEALHPETKREATLKQNEPSRQVGETEKADRFTADTASKTGSSERKVQREAANDDDSERDSEAA